MLQTSLVRSFEVGKSDAALSVSVGKLLPFSAAYEPRITSNVATIVVDENDSEVVNIETLPKHCAEYIGEEAKK